MKANISFSMQIAYAEFCNFHNFKNENVHQVVVIVIVIALVVFVINCFRFIVLLVENYDFAFYAKITCTEERSGANFIPYCIMNLFF